MNRAVIPQMFDANERRVLECLRSNGTRCREYAVEVFDYMRHMHIDDLQGAYAMALVAPWTSQQLRYMYLDSPTHMWAMHGGDTCSLSARAADVSADWRHATLYAVASMREGLSISWQLRICPKCHIPLDILSNLEKWR